ALIRVALDAIEVVRGAPDRERNRGCITAGLGHHLSKLRQKLGDIGIVGPARVWYPPVTVADSAPGAVRARTAHNHPRMLLLPRLRPGPHFREIDNIAVIFGFKLGPDLLHRLDLLAHL